MKMIGLIKRQMKKFRQTRKFDTIYDWTNKTDDEIVKKHIKDYIEISKWLQNECKKYGLPFIDVSVEREERLKRQIKYVYK